MKSYVQQFEDRGFPNRQMLYLCGSDLAVMGGMGLAILVTAWLAQCHAVFKKLLDSLKFSTITRTFIQAFLKICIAGCLNIGIV